MVIIFDSTGKRITDFGTNSLYPDGVPYQPKQGEILFRINDNDTKVQQILSAGSVEGVVVAGVVTDVRTYKRITATTNKQQITANGLDTATITVTCDNPTEVIELWNSDVLVNSKACVAGQCTFDITLGKSGALNLRLHSVTKYGDNFVTVTGV